MAPNARLRIRWIAPIRIAAPNPITNPNITNNTSRIFTLLVHSEKIHKAECHEHERPNYHHEQQRESVKAPFD